MSVSRSLSVAAIVFVVFVCFPRTSSAADLKLAWDPPNDGITAGFIVLYGDASGSYSHQIDVGSATGYTVSNLTAGATYYFAVRSYDAAGDLSNLSGEISTTVPSSTPATLTTIALNPNAPSPQLVGTSINWTASATGGVTPYEFQWSVYKGGSWTVGAWSPAATWVWIPQTAGSDYQIRVAGRSAGSSSTTGELAQSVPFTAVMPISSATLTTNLTAPQLVKTTILWSAAASGGVPPYQYKWWLYNGSSWSAITAWTSTSTWSWTPTSPSDAYVVRVWVRSAGQSVDAAEASASVAFPITKTQKCQGQGPKCR